MEEYIPMDDVGTRADERPNNTDYNAQVETNVNGFSLPTTRTQVEGPGASTSGKTLDEIIRDDRKMNVDNFYDSVINRIETATSEGKKTAFRFLQTGGNVEPPRFYDSFEKVDGELRIKGYSNVRLKSLRGGEFLSPNTISKQDSGTDALKIIGIVFGKPELSTKAKAVVENGVKVSGEIGESLNVDASSIINFDEIPHEDTDLRNLVRSVIENVYINDPNQIVPGTEHPYRELLGLDKKLQTMEGAYANHLIELVRKNREISNIENRLKEDDLSDETKDMLNRALEQLKDERQPLLELVNDQRGELRVQTNRIRQTFEKMLNEDKTLMDRLKTLFREQGITIASILTAIGMTIGVLVESIQLALTGGGGGSSPPTPKPPADKQGLKEWVKKHLQALGRVLAKLAGKAAAALPGIIGSIVSWLLGLLGKAAGFLAENMIVIVLTVGGLLLIAAKDYLTSQKPNGKRA